VTLHQDGLHHGVDCNAARAWKIYIYIYIVEGYAGIYLVVGFGNFS
jgi:hypothetical protein